jgi:hypothetical protein
MAYMNQETKAAKAPRVKAILQKYGMKGSLAVRNHSTLVLNLRSGKLDFGGDDVDINVYHTDSHYQGRVKKFLREVLDVMNEGNYDRSQPEVDYFDRGFYVDIRVGKWNKPYVRV